MLSDEKLEARMVPFQITFYITVFLTIACGLAATCIVVFGDTRRNPGQRAVAEKFAEIAPFGAVTLASLLAVSL
mgnify:CR=1 FL=1